MQEKKEKETLEKRIHGMQSQLLVGGQKLEELPAFRTLLDREHKKIRGKSVLQLDTQPFHPIETCSTGIVLVFCECQP